MPRHARIRYRGFDLQGRPIEREADGFHARVVQHECDHLIGRLYPTRMTDLTQFGYTSVLFPELDPDATTTEHRHRLVQQSRRACRRRRRHARGVAGSAEV